MFAFPKRWGDKGLCLVFVETLFEFVGGKVLASSQNGDHHQNIGYGSLWLISIPTILATLVEPLAEMVDTAFVGRMGLSELAALSACHGVFAVATWLFNFLIHVSTVQLAQATGRRDSERKEVDIKIGLSLAATVGTALCLALLLLRPLLLGGLMNLQSPERALAEAYYDVRAFSMPFVLLANASLGILRGLNHITFSFFVVLGTTTTNIALTALFLSFTDAGLAGVAWGTLLGYGAGALFSAGFILVKHLPRDSLWKGWFVWKGEAFSAFGKRAVNQFLRTLALSGSFLTATALVNRADPLSAASYQVTLQLWLLGAYVLDGLAVTASAVGGKLHAQNDRHNWGLLAQRLVAMGFCVGLGFTALYALFPEVTSVFTTEAAVIRRVDDLWWLICLMQVPNAVAFVFDGLLFGTGDFAFVRKRMVEGTLLLFFPLALASTQIASADTLLFVWFGSSALNFYRLACCGWKTRSRAKTDALSFT